MIHQREIEILNILFSSEMALTSTDIVEQGNRLSQSTVQAVLRKLLKEGFVMVEGVTHSGNVLSRTYKPTEDMINIMVPFLYGNMVVFSHVLKDFSESVRDGVIENTPAVLHDHHQMINFQSDTMGLSYLSRYNR